MKAEYKVQLDRNEMRMIRRMCCFNLRDRKKNTEIRKLLGLEPVTLSMRRDRLQWFWHVERKDNACSVKQSMTTETEKTRQTVEDLVGLCHRDIKSFGLSHEDILSQAKEHWWTEGSLAVNMGPAAAEINKQGHTELHKNISSLCERWDGHLERASRKTV